MQKRRRKHEHGWEDPEDLPPPKPVFLSADDIQSALDLLNKRFPDSCFTVPLGIDEFLVEDEKRKE